MGERQKSEATEGFELGTPALVCRWRLAARTLPLANRHLRALRRRSVNGARVSTQLVAWAKQHVEWTLREGVAQWPDGVLMLVIDERGQAAMTAGPYEPLGKRDLVALSERATEAAREASETGVAPETLWVVRGDRLVVGARVGDPQSGTASLVGDLARTLGLPVEYDPAVVDGVTGGTVRADEAFLVSDEHGIVVADDLGGPRSRRFADGWQTLLDKAGK